MTFVKIMAAAQVKKLATFLGCCTLIIGATIGPVSTGTLLAASTVSSITLTPWDSSIQAGGTQQFTATAKDAGGNPVPGVTFTWTSSNPAVATVSSSGLATGVSGGSTIIGATIGPVSVGTWMTVTSSTVSSITLTPWDSSIPAGYTRQFTASAKDHFGNPVPGATFTWTSSNQSIATVSNSGLATGVLAGSTVIGATIDSVSIGTWMTVTSSTVNSISLTPTASSIQTGQNQQFTATAKDAGGDPVPGVTFTWTSSNPAVAAVNSSGLATGLSGGSAIIAATVGPVSTGTWMSVGSSTVSSITLSPWDSSIQAGGTQQFTATAKDAGGNPVPGVTFTWTSSNQAVATVNSSGLATGVSSGSAIIGATIGPVSVGTWMTVTSSSTDTMSAVTAGGGAGGSRSYSTTFQQTENPISEGGQWLNGLIPGLDWLNIRTASGIAYGTRTNQPGDAIDPTALLTGTGGWNQTAEAVLFVGSVGANKEVELRLNSLLSPHVCNGYEVLWEITGTITIVRWNGPVGNHTVLAAAANIPAITSIGGFKTGDVLKATNVSGRITAYVNGVSVLSAVDTTYQAGAPGFGLNTYGGADPTTYGLSSFTASY